MSNSLDIQEMPNGFRISYRWFQYIAFFLVLFCIAWGSFLIFWYSNPGLPLMFYLFPLIHVAVGVGLSYYTLALFLNRTLIEVDRYQIKISHQPLPWIGNKTVQVADIKQLYVKEILHRHKSSVSTTYDVKAKLKNERTISLIGRGIISHSEDAHWIEEKIEKFLNIPDEPVKGEYR